MRVLLVHNRYKQRGGEDAVFEAEQSLLRSKGVDVYPYTVDNTSIDKQSRLKTAISTIWSKESYESLYRELKSFRPDVVHFHNTFPLISPAGYDACRALGVPVVQTIHNYRLICPNALCFRDGNVCLDCVGRLVPLPAIRYQCYRSSRMESLGVATMLTVHRLLGTWAKKVDTFIALTEFSRDLLIRGGLPEERIVVKPNFLSHDPGVGSHDGGYFLFVGRLSPEKGVMLLFEAWNLLGDDAPPLWIAGDGPLANEVAVAATNHPRIKLLGHRSREDIYSLMRDAAGLIMPSLWFEGFPVTLVEGFATGLPVIASNLGNLASIVRDRTDGLLFSPGDPQQLAKQVRWALSNEVEAKELGLNARRNYETSYSADASFQQLMKIYSETLEGRP